MLEILKNTFNSLEKNNLNYFIYKSLNHLEEDLKGHRGDIDLLIHDEDFHNLTRMLNEEDFFLSLKSKGPYYYVGLDSITHKFILLDVNTKIQFGPKPFKPFSVSIDHNKLKYSRNKDNLRVLDYNDYIPLMFLMRSLSLSEKQKDLNELQEYLDINTINESYMKSIVENITKLEWKEIGEKIKNSSNWQEIKSELSQKIKLNVNQSNSLIIKQRFKSILSKLNHLKRIFKVPSYKIRNKGHLIAFVGVDGAGKSSTVDYIENLDYFKLTGIKRLYFGNNEYWIPGLTKLLKKESKNKLVKFFLRTLSLIDRKIRIYIAWYYMSQGNIVLADRYIYDDEIGRENRKKENQKISIAKRIYRNIFEVKMTIKPNLTIFLDVSPEVAYRRKQDYSFETMLKINKSYKDYMYKIPNVNIINADKSQEEIYTEVVKLIQGLDKKSV